MGNEIDGAPFYSIWLVPEARSANCIGALINDLAGKHGSDPFPPHITLAERIYGSEDRVLRNAELLATGFEEKLVAGTDWIGHSDFYYRSLFVRIKRSNGLKLANSKARAVFKLPESEFMPHMSLMYADLPEPAKRNIADELIRSSPEWLSGFVLDKISVYRIEDRIPKWKEVGRFDIQYRTAKY